MARDSIMPQHHPFVKGLARGLRQRCGLKPGARLLAAVSGGADSVALLRGLDALRDRRGWRLELAVAHVQHHLRDESHAEGDAVFVQQLAGQLGLPFFRADLDPAELTTAGNVEANARRARYRALAELAERGEPPFTHIVTAHHGDDLLETMLMRLVRGASVTGLAGMAWRRAIHAREAHRGDGSAGRAQDEADAAMLLLRPMLGHDRSLVLRFLADLDQPWREDHTNLDVSRQRAKLRRDVLPVLHALQPRLTARITAMSDHLHEVAMVFSDAVEAAYEQCVQEEGEGQFVLPRRQVRLLRRAVLAGVLRRVMLRLGASRDALTRGAIAPIVRAVGDRRGGLRQFVLSRGVSVHITADRVTITQQMAE